MKVVIIGSPAAGAEAAAAWRQLDPGAEILFFPQAQADACAGAGLPLPGVDVRAGREVVRVDPQAKTAVLRPIGGGAEEACPYDQLILAGASPLAGGTQAPAHPAPGGKIPPEEVARVKALGFLWDKRTPDRFNARVITRNGKITSQESQAISRAAQLYGSGEIAMTTRLTVEIQGVPFDKIEPLRTYLAQYGLETGGTGSKVRPVVSCKGTTCQYGLIDTFGLSEQIHRRFYKGYRGVTLPHKFKIAVGGCPNNCVKPDLNDLGIVGQRVPLLDLSKCRGCKKCQVETACPIHVAHMDQGLLKVDPQACNGCGRCTGKCPFGVTEETMDGYRVYIGGRWGKKIANGRPLSKLFTTEAEVLDVVERAILLFRDEGITGERFADTVSRLGFAYVEEKLLSGSIDKGKILEKTVTGGATC